MSTIKAAWVCQRVNYNLIRRNELFLRTEGIFAKCVLGGVHKWCPVFYGVGVWGGMFFLGVTMAFCFKLVLIFFVKKWNVGLTSSAPSGYISNKTSKKSFVSDLIDVICEWSPWEMKN